MILTVFHTLFGFWNEYNQTDTLIKVTDLLVSSVSPKLRMFDFT